MRHKSKLVAVAWCGWLLAGCEEDSAPAADAAANPPVDAAAQAPDAPGADAQAADAAADAPAMAVAADARPLTPDADVADADPAQLARNRYLRYRLEVQRAAVAAPALGAAVVVDDKLLAIGVVGDRSSTRTDPVQLGDYFMLKSCTKPMTGHLAARMVQLAPKVSPTSSKTFSWTTTILDVFPELAPLTNPAYVNTTVAALMSHSSGMPYKPGMEGDDEFSHTSKEIMERRYLYVKAAVQDPPVTPSPYGGGSIVVAAMLERIMGKPWESLMQTYVYDDLGMTNSGVGEAPYPPSTMATVSHSRGPLYPLPWTPPAGYAEEPHAPAGRNPHASIPDFARFAAAQLPGTADRPGSLSLAQLMAAQQRVPGTDSTQGGWVIGKSFWDGSDTLWHNGADGHDYARIQVSPSENMAMVAMTNYEDAAPVEAMMSELHAIKRFPEMAAAYELRTDPTITATASNTYMATAGYEADKAVDGSLATRWATDGVSAASLTMNLGQARLVSRVLLAEEYGRVRGFTLSRLLTSTDGGTETWEQVATGTTIGAYKAVSIPAVRTSGLRLDITDSTGSPTINEVWVR